MKNLLTETIGVLADSQKTPADVKWCGSDDMWFDWETFAKVAEKTNYDSGYGGQEVAKDLVIVGEDWWLERHEYDGNEWWEFKARPARPEKQIEPTFLRSNDENDAYSWSTLLEVNGISL